MDKVSTADRIQEDKSKISDTTFTLLLEPTRRALFVLGLCQIILAGVNIVFFNIISNSLAIASGVILVRTFRSETIMTSFLKGRIRLRETPCSPFFLRPLGVAIVFAALVEVFVAIIVMWQLTTPTALNRLHLTIFDALCAPPANAASQDIPRSTGVYIGIALFMTAVAPILHVLLAAVTVVTYSALLSVAAGNLEVTSTLRRAVVGESAGTGAGAPQGSGSRLRSPHGHRSSVVVPMSDDTAAAATGLEATTTSARDEEGHQQQQPQPPPQKRASFWGRKAATDAVPGGGGDAGSGVSSAQGSSATPPTPLAAQGSTTNVLTGAAGDDGYGSSSGRQFQQQQQQVHPGGMGGKRGSMAQPPPMRRADSGGTSSFGEDDTDASTYAAGASSAAIAAPAPALPAGTGNIRRSSVANMGQPQGGGAPLATFASAAPQQQGPSGSYQADGSTTAGLGRRGSAVGLGYQQQGQQPQQPSYGASQVASDVRRLSSVAQMPPGAAGGYTGSPLQQGQGRASFVNAVAAARAQAAVRAGAEQSGPAGAWRRASLAAMEQQRAPPASQAQPLPFAGGSPQAQAQQAHHAAMARRMSMAGGAGLGADPHPLVGGAGGSAMPRRSSMASAAMASLAQQSQQQQQPSFAPPARQLPSHVSPATAWSSSMGFAGAVSPAHKAGGVVGGMARLPALQSHRGVGGEDDDDDAHLYG